MNKLILGAMAGVALFATSCNTESGDSTQTVGFTVLNLVTPANGGQSMVVTSEYTYTLNYTTSKIGVSNEMTINNVPYNFSLAEGACQMFYGSNGNTSSTASTKPILITQGYVFNNLTGNVNGGSPILNFNGQLVTNQLQVPNIQNYATTQFPVMTYNIGSDYNVKTIPVGAFYLGKTNTTYTMGDQEGSYSNDNMVYAVSIDYKKNPMTAQVMIYNAKFAENAPTITCITLNNLSVELKNGAYEISGENVVPSMQEGNTMTPNEKYTFNSFRMTTTNYNLSKVNINYQVAGNFYGSFQGSYLVESTQNPTPTPTPTPAN